MVIGAALKVQILIQRLTRQTLRNLRGNARTLSLDHQGLKVLKVLPAGTERMEKTERKDNAGHRVNKVHEVSRDHLAKMRSPAKAAAAAANTLTPSSRNRKLS